MFRVFSRMVPCPHPGAAIAAAISTAAHRILMSDGYIGQSYLFYYISAENFRNLTAPYIEPGMKTLLLLPLLFWPCLAADVPRTAYTIDTIAGSSSNGDGGPAAAAQIGSIQGVATDRLGNLYISDTDHHRVRKIDPKGLITAIAGTGTAGFNGDGGPAAQASLNLPYGLAVDAGGSVYIADLGNNRVRRVSPDGIITTFAGGGTAASSGDGGPALSAQLLMPRNVGVDADGAVYISEFAGHRVRKVAGGAIFTAAGNGVAGFRGDGGPALNAQLNSPAGLAVDRSGALYIADSQNQRIRKVAGGVISTVLGGASATALLTPLAVSAGGYGDLYVADMSAVIRRFTAAGAWLNFAGTGDPGYSGDGGPAGGARLSQPLALAADIAGNVLIADGCRLRQVDISGRIQTIAGDAFQHYIGDGGTALNAILNHPAAVALDSSGRLMIADTASQRARRVIAGSIGTVAGNGSAASGPDGAMAADAPLNYPTGIAAGDAGELWIAESRGHRVRIVTSDGWMRTAVGAGSAGLGPEGLPPNQTALNGPRGLCRDRAGSLYVVDTGNHRVLRLTPSGTVETAAGNGSPGAAGDGGSARTAQLTQPSACAADGAGNLYIADTANHRIRKVDPAGRISTIAGNGAAGALGDGGQATGASLNSPAGVAVDDNGSIFITDTANHRIREVTPEGVIRTIAGKGAPGFAGDGGAALDALLDSPGGILLDGAGELYFADTNNSRVRRLTPAAAIQPPPVTVPLAVVNAASMLPGPVAPGELVSVMGSGLGPDGGVMGSLDSSGFVAGQLAGTEVRFDGVAAPLLYAQAGQVNAQTPYTVSGRSTVHLEVFYKNKSAGSVDLNVAAASPAVFPSVVQQDGSLNSKDTPATRGSFLTLYGTGDGTEYGPNVAGLPAAAPYPWPVLPVVVTIGGVVAETAYAGAAPGLTGLLQVNVRVPNVPPGTNVLKLSVGTFAAPDVLVWVQ
jgi:uncharacterized protein (TIGR03437 family)